MRSPTRTWLRRLAALAALAFVAVNVVAWMQAGSMTRWRGEVRTERPEDLGKLAKLGVVLRGVSISRPMNRHTPEAIGRPYTTLRFDSESGAELEAWHLPVAGSAVTALVFHGYASAKDSTLNVAAGLAELGCSVLMVDFYGSGASTGSGTSLGIREAHDVAAAVDACRTRWPEQRLLLYGQSMGGAALLRAIARLDVRPDALAVESTFDRLSSTVASRFHRMGLPAAPLSQLLLFWGSLRVGANAFDHDPVEDAAAVRCPALVLQGEQDPNITLEQAAGLADALGGETRFEVVRKTGHEDIRGSNRELWESRVAELLERMARDAPNE